MFDRQAANKIEPPLAVFGTGAPVRVLLVEKDDDIREIVQIALETVGDCEVAPFANGAEAIEMAREFDPNVVLIDASARDDRGNETLAALRADPRFAKTPVIFLSTRAHARDIEAMKEQGAADVVVKPFDPMTLADKVNSVWLVHRLLQNLELAN